MGNGGACGAAQKRSREREGEEPEEASLPLRLSLSLSLSLSVGAVDLIHPRVHLAAPPGAVAGRGRWPGRGKGRNLVSMPKPQ